MTQNKPPVFKKKEASFDLEAQGIELSKTLPTYDVPVELITPSSWNANEMNDDTFNRLVQEIEENGFMNPIQIAPSTGGKFIIVGGEHRWHGAITLGYEKIPCNILLDKKFTDEKLLKLLSVRLNVIKGDLNPDKFTALYSEMAEEYGAEQLQALFGFTQTDAWKKLISGVEKTMESIVAGNPEMKKEFREKSKKVKTVDGLGKVLKKMFEKHGNDLQHSFMVFTFGGKEHLYVISSDKTRVALEYVKEVCRRDGIDINDVIAPAIETLPEILSKRAKNEKI